MFGGNSLACRMYYVVAAFTSSTTATGACVNIGAASQACM